MKGEKQKLLLLFKSKDPIRKREHLGGIIVDLAKIFVMRCKIDPSCYACISMGS